MVRFPDFVIHKMHRKLSMKFSYDKKTRHHNRYRYNNDNDIDGYNEHVHSN